MRLRQLEYLIAIVDSGSFVRAAEIVGISQPTLSQQIKALEASLQNTLFERSAGGAIPTPICREIAERARPILRDVRELRQLGMQASDRLLGTIRLGTTPTLGPYLLSPAIAGMHRAAPDMRVYVREGIPSEQIVDLVRGQLDLYLGPMPVEDGALVIEPLFREPLRLVVAEDHPLAGAGTVEPGALAGMAILTIDRRHHYHRQVSAIARDYGMRVVGDYEGTSLDSLHQMVASGLGASVLPALYLASDVGGLAGLHVVQVRGWDAYRSIAIAWRRSSALGPRFAEIGEGIARTARDVMHATG